MAERIDSPANKKIKQMESLLLRKHRQKQGLFRVEGVRLAEMAAASGWQLEFGLYTQELAKKERGSRLLQALKPLGPLYEISESLARRVAATDTPQGIFLVMRQPSWQSMELRTTGAALYVVLDGVQDPGNAGTIIRTADAIGADGVILMKGSVDIYSDKVVRASMGSIFHLPILHDMEPAALCALAKREGWQLLATALDETAQPLLRRISVRRQSSSSAMKGMGSPGSCSQRRRKSTSRCTAVRSRSTSVSRQPSCFMKRCASAAFSLCPRRGKRRGSLFAGRRGRYPAAVRGHC